MRSTAVPVHEDGHMEIIEEVGEYLEGSPLIPKEKFVRKGRLPPKRPPGGEVDAFGRRLNSSPSAACAVVPDFQTDIQFIEEDVAALDMHITDDVVICNANIRQEIRAGGADDDPFGLSDFMPRSPSASSGIDKKQTSAGAVVSVSTNNNSRVTARSIPFTSATVSKVSPNPSIGSSNKYDQSSNDSKILSLLDPMSPGMDSCPLPTIGFSPRKAAHSTTSFPSNSKDGGDANRRKSASSQPTLPTIPPATATKVPPALVRATPAANGNGKSTTTTTATRSRARSDTKQGSANTATTATTVPAKIPVAPLTHTCQRSQPVPANRHATSAARPAEADPAHGPKDTAGAREKGNAPVMRSRRNSAADWSSGYAMPSASFLRFTGSGKLMGVEADGNATTTAAATTPKSSAATVTFTDTNTNAVSRTNNNSTLRVRRNSLSDKIRAFEDAIAAHDAKALPASSAPGPSVRPAAKTAGSSGAAAPTTTPPLLSSSGQEEQSPSPQRTRLRYSNRQSRGESSTARDDAAPPHPPATGPSSQKSAPPRNPQSLASSQSATATAAAAAKPAPAPEPRPSRQPPRCSSTITKSAPPAGEVVPGGPPGEAAEELSKTARRSQGNSNAATTATTKSGNDDKPKGRRQSNPKAAVRSRIPDMVEV